MNFLFYEVLFSPHIYYIYNREFVTVREVDNFRTLGNLWGAWYGWHCEGGIIICNITANGRELQNLSNIHSNIRKSVLLLNLRKRSSTWITSNSLYIANGAGFTYWFWRFADRVFWKKRMSNRKYVEKECILIWSHKS